MRKEFAERKKYKRIEEDDLLDFETVEEIDDPYAFMATKDEVSSDEEFKAPEVKTCFQREKILSLLGKRPADKPLEAPKEEIKVPTGSSKGLPIADYSDSDSN